MKYKIEFFISVATITQMSMLLKMPVSMPANVDTATNNDVNINTIDTIASDMYNMITMIIGDTLDSDEVFIVYRYLRQYGEPKMTRTTFLVTKDSINLTFVYNTQSKVWILCMTDYESKLWLEYKVNELTHTYMDKLVNNFMAKLAMHKYHDDKLVLTNKSVGW